MTEGQRQEAEQVWKEIIKGLYGTWPSLKLDKGAIPVIAAALKKARNDVLEEVICGVWHNYDVADRLRALKEE